MVETIVEDPKLDVDIGSVVREGGAGGHLDEVEADDHRVVQPRPRLWGPAPDGQVPDRGQARHGDGERRRVESFAAKFNLDVYYDLIR